MLADEAVETAASNTVAAADMRSPAVDVRSRR
jgi:hypothetical protein